MSIENQNIKKESGKELQRWTYHDNHAGGKVIFECTAKNIFEADEMYQKETGNDPNKQMFVGRRFEKI
ncbi:MAG: hypothetical protein AAB727_00070 [Patescibacteria group bacterium]